MIKKLGNKIAHVIREVTSPKNLEDAIARLYKDGTKEQLEMFKASDERWPGANVHFTGGMAMRNAWNLHGSTGPLNEYFRSVGIWHGDDKSSLIFKALHAKLNNKPFDVAEEAEYYRLFWLRTGLDFDGVPTKLSVNERKEAAKKFKKLEHSRGIDLDITQLGS